MCSTRGPTADGIRPVVGSTRNNERLNGLNSQGRSSSASQGKALRPCALSQATHSASRGYPTKASGTSVSSPKRGVIPTIRAAMSDVKGRRNSSSDRFRRHVLVITISQSGDDRRAASSEDMQQKCWDSWQNSGCNTPSKSRNSVFMGISCVAQHYLCRLNSQGACGSSCTQSPSRLSRASSSACAYRTRSWALCSFA